MCDYQADFSANLYVVSVEGIPIQHMYRGFSKILKDIYPAIKAIYEHKNKEKENENGEPIGRCNFITKSSTFNKTARTLKHKISSKYDTFISENSVPSVNGISFHPQVTRKILVQDIDDDDGSNTTRDSFVYYFANSLFASYTKESAEHQTYYSPEKQTAYGAPIPVVGVSTNCKSYLHNVQQIVPTPTSHVSDMTRDSREN